jgi:ABC-type amino acid transport substrate-binding protein
MTETDKQRAYALYKFVGADPIDVAVKLEKERDELKDIIRRASVAFCEDGTDREICAKMFSILGEASNPKKSNVLNKMNK